MSDQEMKTEDGQTTAAPVTTQAAPQSVMTTEKDAPVATETNAMVVQNAEKAYSTTMNSLYLSAFSFILGVLFTVLVLLILDFMRRNSADEDK